MKIATFPTLFLALLGLWLASCGGGTAEQATTPPPPAATAPAPPAAAAAEAPTSPYPSISAEKMKYLYDNCDYVDFVFYSTNFSMSQDQKPAIQTTLSGVSTTPARVVASCKPIGRIFFQVDGQNAAEADIFLGGPCLYYLFLEDGNYVAGNQMTQGAMEFYQKVFAQAGMK
jgi:hypothetical protein